MLLYFFIIFKLSTFIILHCIFYIEKKYLVRFFIISRGKVVGIRDLKQYFGL